MRARLTLASLLIALLILVALVVPGQMTAVAAPAPVAPAPARPSISVFLDTDTGVDDAVALALLLRARGVNLVGISTVAGNTTVDNATKNVLTVLDVAHRSIPVTIGAAAPLEFPASRVGMFAHGPDGLWFAQRPHDISGLPHDAPAAIAAAARANQNLTIVAVGPLTNIAQAVQRFPQDMATVSIVALAGGTKGNRSPVAETNAFNDPQALDIVLHADLELTLITLDAFDQLTVDSAAFPQALAASHDPLAQFLAQPLTAYGSALTRGQGGPVSIPDAVAALYIISPRIATAQSALVKVSTESGLTRGQTVIATDPNLKVEMIADDAELSALAEGVFSGQITDVNAAVGAILAREPDNAQVIFSLRSHNGSAWLRQGLMDH